MGGFAEIDWNRIWRASRQHRTCKAAASARRNRDSAYMDHLLMIERGENRA